MSEMEFKMNGNKWEIEEISNEEMMGKALDLEGFTHGLTEYADNTVYINKCTPAKIKTLYHELMHVFLYEYGHNQFGDKKWNNEDLCEISASSHDIIHKIVEEYIREIDREKK